jgi:hypothetical protein
MSAPPPRQLRPGQRARIRVWDRHTSAVRTVVESRDRRYEAPNWTADDRLLVNGDGKLWLLPADGSAPPQEIPADGLPDVNNDHVLAPDGTTVFASANDWHIWAVPLAGGTAHRVTADDGGAGAVRVRTHVRPDNQRRTPAGGWWSRVVFCAGAGTLWTSEAG